MNRPALYDWPRQSPRLLFWNMPNQFNDLVSVRLVSEDENTVGVVGAFKMANSKTKFRQLNYTIWKCRELIVSEDLVIASPHAENHQEIIAIFPKSTLTDRRTTHLLENLKLTVSQTEEVISSELKTCLSYSLRARLTPKWNSVGELLVEGKDFLSNQGPINAIKLEAFTTPDECYLALEGYPIKLPKMDLEYIGVNPEMLAEFRNKDYDCIQQYFMCNPCCHILPSMKRGEISSITHSIPDNSVFSSYQELQHYWRNTYGYQLPNESENNLYYNVLFRMIDNQLFTYPECCICRNDIVIIPRIDQNPIIESFVKDMLSIMPNICGIPWQFQNQMASATLQLTSAKQGEGKVWPTISIGACSNKYPLKGPLGFVKAAELLDRNLQTEIQDKRDITALKKSSSNMPNIIAKVKVTRGLLESSKLKDDQNKSYQQPKNAFIFANKEIIQPRISFNSKKGDGRIEKMAKQGQLGKVKCSILSEWLRQNGFTCNTRIKKVEMIENVYKTLNILKPEP